MIENDEQFKVAFESWKQLCQLCEANPNDPIWNNEAIRTMPLPEFVTVRDVLEGQMVAYLVRLYGLYPDEVLIRVRKLGRRIAFEQDKNRTPASS